MSSSSFDCRRLNGGFGSNGRARKSRKRNFHANIQSGSVGGYNVEVNEREKMFRKISKTQWNNIIGNHNMNYYPFPGYADYPFEAYSPVQYANIEGHIVTLINYGGVFYNPAVLAAAFCSSVQLPGQDTIVESPYPTCINFMQQHEESQLNNINELVLYSSAVPQDTVPLPLPTYPESFGYTCIESTYDSTCIYFMQQHEVLQLNDITKSALYSRVMPQDIPLPTYPESFSMTSEYFKSYAHGSQQPSFQDQIRQQVEYYFSAKNLQSDKFLRKNMDRQGFVDIALIAQFPKMLALKTDIYVITEALKGSKKLQVSHNGKVRCIANPEHWVIDENTID